MCVGSKSAASPALYIKYADGYILPIYFSWPPRVSLLLLYPISLPSNRLMLFGVGYRLPLYRVPRALKSDNFAETNTPKRQISIIDENELYGIASLSLSRHISLSCPLART
jgi:hypothetical protein